MAVIAMMVMLMPARVILVMGAALGFVDPLAVEPGVDQFFDSCPGLSGANGDALLRKEGQRAPPDAAGDHDVGTLLVQPPREKARRVRRRHHGPGVEDFALLGVRLHQRELPAAAKVSVEAAFDRRPCLAKRAGRKESRRKQKRRALFAPSVVR